MTSQTQSALGVTQQVAPILVTNPDGDRLSRTLKYEHPLLVRRLIEKHSFSPEVAQELFNDTKRFLYICGTHRDGSWGPPPQIDECWHEFMLFSRDYADFCHKHFGHFIHHRPNHPDEPKDVRRPRRTLALAMEIFGADLSDNWIYPNEKGEPMIGPRIASMVDVADMCGDSCGCSPCD